MDKEPRDKAFVPALAYSSLTPFYQMVVDAFCRDSYVKGLVTSKIEGENLNILDIACGPGKLVRLVAEKQQCCTVTGMDIDAAMVETARRNTSDIENICIMQGDATQPPFADSQFDIVIESLMFHHLPDDGKRRCLEHITRILRPSGLFYFVDWVQPQSGWSKLSFNVVQLLDGAENVRAHADNSVLSMIEQAGFLVMEDEVSYVETSVGTVGVIPYRKVR